jgi:serine/threonine protein kinase/WD40 repeat protein
MSSRDPWKRTPQPGATDSKGSEPSPEPGLDDLAETLEFVREPTPSPTPTATAPPEPVPNRAADLPAGAGGEVRAGVDSCVRDLIECGLVDAAELAAFRARIASPDAPADAQTLARELVRAGRLTSYQAGAVLQGKTKGLFIGNYVVLDKLGAGGMGMVFKARHSRLKRDVALKLLPPSVARDPSAVLRFQREAKAAAKLSHPNVVAVLDADEFRGLHFLVMEYVEGRDLARLVRQRGPLPVPEAIDCLVQAARGLKAASEASVVHRDIKPSNLLLEPGGTLKILDMGLARLETPAGLLGTSERERQREPDADLTQSNVLMGTVDYMSPEQAFDPRCADHRSDIYSLGCTLYFLLTGRPPFSAETLVGRLVAHREHPIPVLSDARPDAPRGLDDLLKRMLAKSPADRVSSFDDLIAALEACRETGTPGGTAPRRPRRFGLIAGLAAAGLVLVLVASVLFWSRSGDRPARKPLPGPASAAAPRVVEPRAVSSSPPPPAPTPVVPPVKDEPVPEAVAIAAARPRVEPVPEPVGLVREFPGHLRRVNAVAVSMDGLRALSGGQDRTVRLWDVATSAEQRRFYHDGPVSAVALSADGRLALSGSSDRSVRLWDLSLEHEVGMRRLDGHTGPVFAVAFAPDGRTAVSGGADQTVHVWVIAAGNGRPDGSPLVHESPVVALAALAHESALAGCDDGTLWQWDLRSRQRVRFLIGPAPVLCLAASPQGDRAVTGHADGLLVAWDLDRGAEIGRLVAHGDLIRAVAFLPDGRYVLAGSQSGLLLLWDVETRRAIHRFPDRAGQLSIAILSDRRHALTAETDGTLRLWRLPATD